LNLSGHATQIITAAFRASPTSVMPALVAGIHVLDYHEV
jgi:hypothetical protein